MMTLPTAFAALKDREATGACFILALTHATLGTVRLSTKSVYLSVGDFQIEGIVCDFGSIGQAVNLEDHSYGVSNVTVTLASGWNRRNTAGEWTRIVDVIQGCWGRQAQILIYPGSYATGLADCLTIFDGTVTRFAQRSDGGLTIELDERFPLLHRILPQRLATRAIFPDLPEDQVSKRMPLAYGQPSEGYLYFKQTGFFPGVLVSAKDHKYLIADHPSVSPGGAAWIGLPAVDSWGAAYAGVTNNVNDAGRTTVALDPLTLQFLAYVFPTGGAPGSSAVDGANPTGPAVAFDNNGATKVSVIAESTTLATIVFEWGQNGDSSNDYKNNSVARLDVYDGTFPSWFGFLTRYHISLAVTPTTKRIEYWNGAAWVDFGATSTSIMATNDFWVGAAWNYANSASGVLWHLNTGPTGGDGLPFKIRFRFNNTAANWVANTTVVAYIHEVHLALPCNWPTTITKSREEIFYQHEYKTDVEKLFHLGRGRHSRMGWVERSSFNSSEMNIGMDGTYGGRMYGTWIDEDGRSSNGLNAGQPITTAAGIIESLLRDELGLTSAQIDYASFDTVHSTYPSTAYLSLMDANAADSEEIIRTLCWEHGYFLLRIVYWDVTTQTAVGKIKIVNYLGTGVGGTIYPSHLDELPEVQEVAVTGPFKRATINHTRLPHDNKYKRTMDLVDGNPSLLNDAIKTTIDLQTIRSVSSSPTLRLTTRLLGTERLMSQPHFLVTLKTTGFRWIALEICDLITLDYLSFNPQLKLMGQSWQGKSMMIFKKEVTETGVEFACIYWTPAPL